MRYYKQMKLNSGKTCILRNASADDAEQIQRSRIQTSGETENMLRYPDEITITTEAEAEYLQNLESSADAILICAEIDGQIVGSAGFDPVARVSKCRHRAEFGISIQQSCWGLGIGSLLTAAIIESARNAGYIQLELEVVADNYRAVALYERFGFKTWGTNEKGFLTRSGRYQPLHSMSLEL